MFTKTRVPQYFFGDDINRDDKSAKNDSILLGISSIEDFHASEPNLSIIPSPTSSVASAKKLEWDSGADIGYNNIYNSLKNSRRSKSFPTLNMDLSISQINKSDETQGDEISENKMTDDITKENSNINFECTSQLKPQKSKRTSSFKHSTPYEEKMIFKVSKDSGKDKLKNTNKDECLQTTPICICSKSVQTDDNLIKDNQKVDKSQQTDTLKSSSYSGSSLSKSSSFQYIPGSNKSKSSTDHSDTARTANSDKSEPKSSKCETGRSKISKSETSKSSENHTEESNSSNNSPLGKIIATQQSKHLIKDIDKSLHMLHKFIKSNHYTTDTKRHYAKKIVSKIITNKYTDDSTSRSSSSNISTGKSNETPIEPNIRKKSSNNEDVNDFVANKEPEKVSCGVQCEPFQKSVSTETNQNKIIAAKLEELISKNNKITEKSKHKHKSDLHSDKNWRDAETISEKLFAARKNYSSSDEIKNIDSNEKSNFLIEHSKKERKRQLSWISNEISYLHRLKELLQKNDSSSNSTVNAEPTKNKCQSNKSPQSNSSDKNIGSSISDIEIKFYQEFGTNSTKAEKMDTLKKLSKYLTNDQIKFIIDDDTKKVHCQTCECCTQKQIETSPKHKETESSAKQHLKSPPKQNKSTETNQNTSSLQEFSSHDTNNHSFNSHSYKFYENLIRSCNNSRQNSPTPREKIERNQISQADAGIQCTIRKKKPSHISQYDSSYSVSTDYSRKSLKDENIEVFYKNYSNFNNSDSQSTEYGRIESDNIFPDFNQPLNKGKENYSQRNPVKNMSTQPPTIPSQNSIAYLLTFEEESMIESSESLPKNAIEQVTIKVPKHLKPSTDRRYQIETRKSLTQNTCLTLQEYLQKNRPNFVHQADWRRNVISEHSERRSRNIFTCSQMKEITSKTYHKLEEVQSKKHICKVLNQKVQNRCKAKEFSKKLQKKTLTGQMCIATCINVLSSE